MLKLVFSLIIEVCSHFYHELHYCVFTQFCPLLTNFSFSKVSLALWLRLAGFSLCRVRFHLFFPLSLRCYNEEDGSDRTTTPASLGQQAIGMRRRFFYGVGAERREKKQPRAPHNDDMVVLILLRSVLLFLSLFFFFFFVNFISLNPLVLGHSSRSFWKVNEWPALPVIVGSLTNEWRSLHGRRIDQSQYEIAIDSCRQ